MPFFGKNLTSQQLYEQISKGTQPGDVFYCHQRLKAERAAIFALLTHGKVEIVHYATDNVLLKRLQPPAETE